MSEWLSVKQAAEGLGTSVQWIHRLIGKDDGRLKFQRVGAYYLVSADSIRRLKRKSREKQLRAIKTEKKRLNGPGHDGAGRR